MRVAVLVVLALLAGAPSGPARASGHDFCEASLADWQPRDALQAKLEAQGWRDVAIRVEDGCYLVHASNDRGERLHGLFDPATLDPLPGRGRGHGRHGHDGWGDHGDGDGRDGGGDGRSED